MEQDFDYVTFADYESDMRETAEQATAVIRKLIEERDRARLLFWAAVQTAGGDLSIPRQYLQRGMPKEWEISDDICNDGVRYRIIRATGPHSRPVRPDTPPIDP